MEPMGAEPDAEQVDAATLLGAAHRELHELARHLFRGERAGHTMQPTALMGELWVRLMQSDRTHFESEDAFWSWASSAMRHILIDHARRRNALKRGSGWTRERLTDVVSGQSVDIIELGDSIDQLFVEHPRAARVLEMRFFGGMTEATIATRLGIGQRTVRADWRFARGWLYQHLGEAKGSGS